MFIGKCAGVAIILASFVLMDGASTGSGQTGAPGQPSAEAVAKLVAQLNSSDFDSRQRATAELVKFGGPILPALRKAVMTNSELEVKRRIEFAVSQIEKALLKAEEKHWEELDAPRREIKDRLEKILAQTPALTDDQQRSAIYLLTLSRRPNDEEIQRTQKQFSEVNGRAANILQLARSLVQSKEFVVEVGAANSRLLKLQKDLAKEMDLEKKQLFLLSKASGAQKITSEVGAALNKATKSDETVVDLAFLLTLSRFPTAMESTPVAAYLKREQNRPRAIEDAVWALINSREFLLAP